MEEGGPSKDEGTQRKKGKKDTMEKIPEDKGSEDIGKDGSEMEIDDSEGEESWKEEEVGEEEGGDEEVSDQNSLTLSVSIGIVKSQPMEEQDKINEEREMEIEQEKEKETELEKDKENSSGDQDKAGEGIILDKLKNQFEARMGFDRWVYEGIKNLEKTDRQQEEKGKKAEINQEQWNKGMEEKVEKSKAQIGNLEEGKNSYEKLSANDSGYSLLRD